MEKKNGLWISEDILKMSDLTFIEKGLLSEIVNLDQDGKGCYATNRHFVSRLGVTERSISNMITKFKQDGFISETPNGRGRVLRCVFDISNGPDETSLPPEETSGPENSPIIEKFSTIEKTSINEGSQKVEKISTVKTNSTSKDIEESSVIEKDSIENISRGVEKTSRRGRKNFYRHIDENKYKNKIQNKPSHIPSKPKLEQILSGVGLGWFFDDAVLKELGKKVESREHFVNAVRSFCKQRKESQLPLEELADEFSVFVENFTPKKVKAEEKAQIDLEEAIKNKKAAEEQKLLDKAREAVYAAYDIIPRGEIDTLVVQDVLPMIKKTKNCSEAEAARLLFVEKAQPFYENFHLVLSNRNEKLREQIETYRQKRRAMA